MIHRFSTAAEIDAIFARMALYNMNYVRIFTIQSTETTDMLKIAIDKAKQHGIYVNLVLYTDSGGQFLTSDPAPYKKSKQWAAYILEELKTKDNIFMLDVCNDIEPARTEWAKFIIPYVRSHDAQNRLITLQPHTDATLATGEFGTLPTLLDAYSTRAYDQDPNVLLQKMIANYNRELTVQPPKPVYIGEVRYLEYNLHSDWQTTLKPSIVQGTKNVLEYGKAHDLQAIHFFAHPIRAEYVNSIYDPLFSPLLTPEEYMLVYSNFSPPFPTDSPTPSPIPGDLNHSGAVDLADISIFLSEIDHDTCGNLADLNQDCQVDILDYNVIITHYGQG